jgi:hypothetical protein
VDANPESLKLQSDKEKYLSLRVWLKILERFELNPLDETKRIRSNLPD